MGATYPLGMDLSYGSLGYSLALDVVVISIVLAALALGVSRALGSRKLWAWGAEELAQALINAALLGILMAWGAGVGASLGGALPAGVLAACPGLEQTNAPLSYDLCVLNLTLGGVQRTQAALLDGSFSLGMISHMSVNLNVLSATPFSALDAPAQQYAQWAGQLAGLQSLLEANRQFLALIGAYAFGLFLPLGLVLRLFFATRKLGGAILAGAIGFYVVYPLAYAALANGPALDALASQAQDSVGQVSRSLAPLPQFDWDKPGDMAALVEGMTNKNLSSTAAAPYGQMPAFLGALYLHAIAYPLIALVLALALSAELAALLGREMFFEVFKEA